MCPSSFFLLVFILSKKKKKKASFQFPVVVDVLNTLFSDESSQEVIHYHEETTKNYKDTIRNLERVNKTVAYILDAVDKMQSGIENTLRWLTNFVGGTGQCSVIFMPPRSSQLLSRATQMVLIGHVMQRSLADRFSCFSLSVSADDWSFSMC